ncbi:hypothetical protein GCM10029964_059760 [Kibdelosporangium lantanae]
MFGTRPTIPGIIEHESVNGHLSGTLGDHTMAVQRVDAPDIGTLFLVDDQDTARAAFTDPRLSRDARNAPDWLRALVEANQQDTSMGRNMLDSDPPEHTRLRQAVKRAFTPRRVEGMRPRVEAIAAALLDDIAGHDQVDLIETYAFPLPMTVMCDLLGLPHADRADFRAWTVPLVDRDDRERTIAAGKNMRGYLEQFVTSLTVTEEDVDAQPSFTHALLREGQLDHDELVSMLILLLIAGHETTVNLIGNAVVALVNHPDQLPCCATTRPRPSRNCCGWNRRWRPRCPGSPPRTSPSTAPRSRPGPWWR